MNPTMKSITVAAMALAFAPPASWAQAAAP